MNLQMNLRTALRYAQQIARELAPFCERIEIAGSVRRGRPTVNDIDLVAIPKDLAGLRARLTRNCISESTGDENLRVMTSIGVQVDVFLAHAAGKAGKDDLFADAPSTWGSVFLCRTGSKEHNVLLASRAKARGLTWRIQKGLFTAAGECVASESEHDIFRALGLAYVAPEKREL